MNTSKRILNQIEKGEWALEQLDELAYFLECDAVNVVYAVKKMNEDYQCCMDMLDTMRNQMMVMERRAA